MTELLWLLPLVPLAGAAATGLLGRRLPKRAVTLVAVGASGAAFVLALAAFMELLSLAPGDRRIEREFFTWIAAGDFTAQASLLLDPLSAVMTLVVTGVGFIIHIYSIGYMRAEDGYYRFFAYMNLFLFSMLLLVLAGNFLLMFVGWEGVGLCSYLLIGYDFHRPAAADAGKKAFVVNRIGDVGFILGVLLVFLTFGDLGFGRVFGKIASDPSRFPPEAGVGVLTSIALLLFVGATGKSAQIPLHVWLPDAMEGPTPVSALIHAATMVTAGVYMVVRCAPLFSRAPVALDVVLVVGLATALMAATIGLAQTDIKRVLAYSTVSQLGFMFMAAGAGAFSAGIFHLMTHAFFKALLFLGAGSVIHALSGEQDLRRMGGLRRRIPVTFWTMLVAALAISGIFPLAGFFSKDEILWAAWAGGHPTVWILGLLTAGLTALYMFRLIYLAFFGEPRHAEGVHPHESPRSMTGPLVALAILSAAGGFIGLPAWLGANRFARFLEPSLSLVHRGAVPHFSHALEFAFAALSVAVALAGIFAAHRIYLARPGGAGRIAARWGAIHRLLRDRYRVDEFYDRAVVRPLLGLSERTLWQRVDVGVIDRAVNGAGASILSLGGILRGMQNGLIRSYAAWILAGMAAVLLYLSLLRS
ncbi:MAG: NADH-quinone oxidoreductase subunit L [Acidobacteria bacterium]|nr:NADH-quinone oxidoreductase subunit L [Acidobacteriota bacterium]